MQQIAPITEYTEIPEVINSLEETHELEQDYVVEVLQTYAVKNRIACGRLRKIAKELGLPSNRLGAIAKQHNIKIVACELGCF
ncbi:hypothetical protein BHU72_06300 [Desulfuribacillus stibiiarsenatis]|uniref:Uncharacterized protein n=1 Tax=Desulfuribacillus stibiiarsenatis TaxID=1390249 RepID=A0A1E5L573_9FIRM|nr:hypothetical protein [Desulfuribacillus stibiiarsenatis]OEH85214.1 hypothetical protein BHU72_06300 [Desulfuribacillus stibiiarsenatis]